MHEDTSDIEFESRQSLTEHLRSAGPMAGEAWLWCLHCRRFFQAKHLRIDFLGNRQQCPFDDCGAAGLDVDIYKWDDWAAGNRRWPANESKLRHGMRSP